MIDFGLLKTYAVDAFLSSAQPTIDTQLKIIRAAHVSDTARIYAEQKPSILHTLQSGPHPAAKMFRHS